MLVEELFFAELLPEEICGYRLYEQEKGSLLLVRLLALPVRVAGESAT